MTISKIKISLLLLILGLIFTQYYFFIPISKRLLNSNPSVIGLAEFIVFFVHGSLGISIFLMNFLFEKELKIKTILLISIIYTILFDYVVCTHVWMFIGLFIIKFFLFFLLHKYYINNITRIKSKLIICIIVVLIIALIYIVYNKF